MSKIEKIEYDGSAPTGEERNPALFNALWESLKSWDVNVPEAYRGYSEVTGSHIGLIIRVVERWVEPVIREREKAAWEACWEHSLSDLVTAVTQTANAAGIKIDKLTVENIRLDEVAAAFDDWKAEQESHERKD